MAENQGQDPPKRVNCLVGLPFRLRFSPFLAQVVVTRRCNLACGYCFEYDRVSPPLPVETLEARLARLRELGTFGVTLVGGEPTLHPQLLRLIRFCRAQRFVTGMITNGMLLTPELIGQLNDAGLQMMSLSVDGVHANEVTQKVLDNLEKRLVWLKQGARFHVTVTGVIGAAPPDEVHQVMDRARRLGYHPRVLLLHDEHGQVRLSQEETRLFESLVERLPRHWTDMSDYKERLVRQGRAPFKCRAGSRYLYVDEHGDVAYCAHTRKHFARPLESYTAQDLREQFYRPKSCSATCTIGCCRSASFFDQWRSQ